MGFQYSAVAVHGSKAQRVRLFVLSTALCALAADQVTKWLVTVSLVPGNTDDVVPGLLAWTFIGNLRGAYGLFGSQPWLLIIMAIGVLGIFAYAFRDLVRRSTAAQVAYGLIVGGALGNIIDRLHYGFVVDFISLRPLPIFEVFNVADACVSVGVALLIVSGTFYRKPRYALDIPSTVAAAPQSGEASVPAP